MRTIPRRWLGMGAKLIVATSVGLSLSAGVFVEPLRHNKSPISDQRMAIFSSLAYVPGDTDARAVRNAKA